MATPLIALLTDFGSQDPFVGIMKGVIARIAPGIPLVDLTHEIPPGDILRAGMFLWQSIPYFLSKTVFLCVVDPGVGTSRRPLIMSIPTGQSGAEQIFIGPDNGMFTFIHSDNARAWELANPEYRLPGQSATFHGRDIFAPAAAYAALGISGPLFGPPIENPVRLELPRLASPLPHVIEGEALFADRFGNILTSLGKFEELGVEKLLFKPWLKEKKNRDGTLKPNGENSLTRRSVHLELPDGSQLPLVRTFTEAPDDRAAAIIGSSGLIEIIANRRSAADLLKLEPGTIIRLQSSDVMPAKVLD
jgi:S-adenosyl-L-methionine hydrolase (adenosine-forming)